MLSAIVERNQFETEEITNVSEITRKTLLVRLVPEPFEGIQRGSGLLVITLLIGQNPKHALYNFSFGKTLKKDFVVEVKECLEKEVALSLFSDEIYQEATAQAITIVRSLKKQRDFFVLEFLKVYEASQVRSCLAGTEEHIWRIEEVFPSGNFRVRRCRVCSTKETIGK